MNNSKFKIAVFSLALAFISCKKDEKPAVSGDMMTFTGRIGGGGAKTEINGFEVTWSKGDQVRINNVDCGSELTSDRKTATFTGAVTPANKYEAYYPASLYKDGKYVLPATQTCYPDSVNTLSSINPMYAYSGTTDLQFYNICALMKLQVKGEGTVKTITVTADKPLSGEFTIEGDAETGFYAQLKPSSSKADHDTLTLDCGEAGVPLNADKDTIFYIALPQGEYTDLKFTLTGRDGITWSSSPVTRNLEAGKMQVRELVDVSVVKPKMLPGEFSVSASKEVQFSRGNIQAKYNGSGYDWGFAENQWDYIGNDKGNTNIGSHASGDVVDLFGWSTSATNYGISTLTSGEDYSGDFIDWGGAIDNKDTWRTLTSGEWEWLFGPKENPIPGTNCRTTTYSKGSTTNIRYAEVKVNGVRGILLFPDEFSWPLGSDKEPEPTTFNFYSENWNDVDYVGNDFAALEDEGCVFLPAAGYRDGTSVNYAGSYGYYWSSSPVIYYAYSLCFHSGGVNPATTESKSNGFSVRLAHDVK